MRQAAYLLVVAAFIPKVATTAFRRSNHLAFVVRGGADKDQLEAIHSSAISTPSADLGPKVDGDETKNDADLENDSNAVMGTGNDDGDARKIEIECVGDACTVRGGADVAETTESLDQVDIGEGEDAPPHSQTNEAQGDSIDDEEMGGGEESEKSVDANTVRGGADEPESTDSPEPTVDSIDGDVEGEAADKKDDEDDSGGDSGENAGDSTSVRGGADEPEPTDSPDLEGQEGDEKSPVDGEFEDEAVEKKDDEENSGAGSGESVGDSTSVRGGADAPEPTQSHDPNEAEGDEEPPIDDEVKEKAEEASENIDDDKDSEGGADETVGDATSIRGGAKDVTDSPDFAEEDEYEYENEGDLELEAEAGQYDGVEIREEEESYEDDYEFGGRETANVVRKEEILIGDEAEEFHNQNPIIEVAPEFGHQHATDDDSSAFVDRDELADAYDDDEAFVGATSFRAGHTDEDDRASIDDVPGAEESTGTQLESQDDADEVEQEAGEGVGENVDEEKAMEPALEAISKEVEQILINECGFRKSELRGMKPQIANLMAEKRLRRPQEGIPDSWYEEKKKGLVLATLAKVLTAVIPLALGALVVFGDIDFSKLLERLRKSELLIGVQEEKPRKDDSELTIPGTETEDDFEEKIVEGPEPAPSNMNRLFRFRRSGAQAPTNK